MAKNLTFKVPPNPTGVYTVSVGNGGTGGSDAGNFVLGGGGGSIGTNKIPPHLIVDSTLGGHHISNNIHQNFVDHTITGQTIMAEYVFPPDYNGMNESEIKGLLIEKLSHEMFKTKCVEFTRMERHETDETIFRARIHVVPDTQVRIIRELKDARKTT